MINHRSTTTTRSGAGRKDACNRILARRFAGVPGESGQRHHYTGRPGQSGSAISSPGAAGAASRPPGQPRRPRRPPWLVDHHQPRRPAGGITAVHQAAATSRRSGRRRVDQMHRCGKCSRNQSIWKGESPGAGAGAFFASWAGAQVQCDTGECVVNFVVNPPLNLIKSYKSPDSKGWRP